MIRFLPVTEVFLDYVNQDILDEYKQDGILTANFYSPFAAMNGEEHDWTIECDHLIDLLQPLQDTHIIGDFFLELLKVRSDSWPLFYRCISA